MGNVSDRIIDAARVIRAFEVESSGYSEVTAKRHYNSICGLAEGFDGKGARSGPFGMFVVGADWPDTCGMDPERVLDASESLARRFEGDGYCESKAGRARRVGRLLYLSLAAAGAAYTPANAEEWASAAAGSAHWQAGIYGRTLREIACTLGHGDPCLPRRGELDGIPDWASRDVAGYLATLRREGLAEGTVIGVRDACVRLTGSMAREGASDWGFLDASRLRRWCLEDPHLTTHGRRNYVLKVRGLIAYLGELGVVDSGLYLAAEAPIARSTGIVDILTEEDVRVIEEARLSAETPLELRDAAMVALGLTMGLRSCDVARLRGTDIDWARSKVSVIQAKTLQQVDLPLTVAAGNALVAYLRSGRPATDVPEVFVTARSPHRAVGRLTCRDALYRTLGKGHPFHSLRRTFATNMLRGGAGRSDVAEALGHKGVGSVGPYLCLDEDRMRMCALSEDECKGVES